MILQKLRFKNFLSAGNAFIEIDLQKYRNSVIGGKNGMGKSSFLNALSFGAFGKTIRAITKGQVVNSINGKNCMVELELSANTKQYLIRRGVKPNVFEIFEDGILLDQSAVGDYQQFLEDKILKCSYRTFLQTSVISIENYKPFMSLAAKERRDFIEDILDIKVFSVMNTLIKTKNTKNKDELKLLDITLKGLKDKLVVQKQHIEQLEKIKKEGTDQLDKKQIEYDQELIEANKTLDRCNSLMGDLSAKRIVLNVQRKFRDDLNTLITETNAAISPIEKELLFFDDHENCPVCKQEIDSDHNFEFKERYTMALKDLKLKRDRLLADKENYSTLDDAFDNLQESVMDNNSDISSANSSITRVTRLLQELDKERVKINAVDDTADQKTAMKESAKEAIKIRDRQAEINTEQDYNVVMLELFKDSGIKSKIVEQYIPVINKLVNEYLEKLEFFVSFNLDSEFNEVIKSRHRDDFTYNSFSAGEKQRIDLSLLFTFRQLSKMKNSFETNILCFDEVLDASIDSDGINNILEIFNSTEFVQSNIFIISHGNIDKFGESFDGVYEVTKRDGFTEISDAATSN
jgi:DNA repair exonuclease SbcCD ATPase subunit